MQEIAIYCDLYHQTKSLARVRAGIRSILRFAISLATGIREALTTGFRVDESEAQGLFADLSRRRCCRCA